MSELVNGDEVQLKSGGPKMVISELGDFSPMGPREGARCVWFDKSKKMEDVFDIAVLKKYSDPGIGTVSVRRG